MRIGRNAIAIGLLLAMAKRATPQNKKMQKPSSTPPGAADEASAYRDDPLALTAPPDNLYDAIRAEVERLGGGFKFEPLQRVYHRDPPDFSDPSFGFYNEE